MPYLVMKRDDIPDGTLQVLDLDPNESLRNTPYEPFGQTKYVNQVKNDTVVLAGTDPIVTVGELSGLAAFFVTQLDDGGGDALTAAEANANATAVLGLLAYGDLSAAAGSLALATVNAAITGTLTGTQHRQMLEILAGRTYTVPSGTQVEASGSFDVSPAVGAEGGPVFGVYRPTYDTGALTVSFAEGKISGFLRNDFTYQGVGGSNGEALVVYNDDGTLYTP
jgi:hypothetical protein